MRVLFLFSILAFSGYALAAQAPSNKLKSEEVTGQQTRIWLQIQRENMIATGHKDTLTPQAAKAAQQRAEESFSHAIPEKFIKNDFGE